MGERVHGFTDDVLGDNDAVGIASLIARGDISAAEAVDAAIERVKVVDPHIHAVVHEAFDRARKQAAHLRPSALKPFAGVPSFIKDNNDVAGMPTRCGSAAITPHPAKRDFPPAAQFLAQGYVVLGKSSMPEFGLTASTEFEDGSATRNPWDTDYSAGASSGGSAALVASGAVPIAHANDGGGSIRIPAAANGLVGLKTTRGRTRDQPGARQLPLNVAAEGVVSRTVRDTAHHLAALERTYRNNKLTPVGLVEGPGKRRLRIGLATNSPAGSPVDATTIDQTRDTANLLAELGHRVDEVMLPSGDRFVTDFSLYWGFFAVLLTTATRLSHRGHFDIAKLDPVTRGLSKAWRARRLETPGAIRRLRAARADYDAMFTHHDVILSPTLNHPTPKIGYLDPRLPFDELFDRMTSYVGFTPINNVCGGPAIALPTPLLPAGLPGSIHLSGAWGDEATLLALAYELEAARPFPDIRAARTV